MISNFTGARESPIVDLARVISIFTGARESPIVDLARVISIFTGAREPRILGLSCPKKPFDYRSGQAQQKKRAPRFEIFCSIIEIKFSSTGLET